MSTEYKYKITTFENSEMSSYVNGFNYNPYSLSSPTANFQENIFPPYASYEHEFYGYPYPPLESLAETCAPSLPRRGIPLSFDSRKAASMLFSEKVNQWIMLIPHHITENNEIEVDCFPGAVSVGSSQTSRSQDYDSSFEKDTYGRNAFDFSEMAAILEHQAQKISKYTSMVYRMEPEEVVFGAVSDDNNLPFSLSETGDILMGLTKTIHPLRLFYRKDPEYEV